MFNPFSIILLFHVECLNTENIQYLESAGFNVHPPFVIGYMATENISDFLLTPEVYSITSLCAIELFYDLQFQVEELKISTTHLPNVVPETTCDVEHTNSIYYNQSLKPNAWDLDFFDTPNDFNYNYPNIINSFVELWILDTGINWRHKEFEGIEVVDVDPFYNISSITHPHGTGTAACAGGKNYGSSKPPIIYNYPVCRVSGSCYGSDIDKGMRIVLNRLQNRNERCNTSTIEEISACTWNIRIIINLSVGNSAGLSPIESSYGQYLDNLFKDLNDYGAIIFVAAGNSNQDACQWFYSFSDKVISVGSINQNLASPYLIEKSSFSNWGACVDLWSYGSGVPTAYSITDNNVIQYKAGTSFSSPLAAGLGVNILNQFPNVNRHEMLQYLTIAVQNFTVAKYDCNNVERHCCDSKTLNTRKSKFCQHMPINSCNLQRDCKIVVC